MSEIENNQVSAIENNPVSAVDHKKYIAVFDQVGIACLGRLMPGITFVEILGMSLSDNPNVQVLVNPLPKPVVENENE